MFRRTRYQPDPAIIALGCRRHCPLLPQVDVCCDLVFSRRARSEHSKPATGLRQVGATRQERSETPGAHYLCDGRGHGHARLHVALCTLGHVRLQPPTTLSTLSLGQGGLCVPLTVQVKKADDCIGPEVEAAVKDLKNGEVRKQHTLNLSVRPTLTLTLSTCHGKNGDLNMFLDHVLYLHLPLWWH